MEGTMKKGLRRYERKSKLNESYKVEKTGTVTNEGIKTQYRKETIRRNRLLYAR